MPHFPRNHIPIANPSSDFTMVHGGGNMFRATTTRRLIDARSYERNYQDPRRKFEMNPRDMSSLNASSIAKCQQWRKELLMKPSDPIPMPNDDIFKEPVVQKFAALQALGQHGHHGQQGHSGRQGRAGQQGQPGQQGFPCQQIHPGLAVQQGPQGGGQHQVLASAATICCDQVNCDRYKIEQLPEQYFQEPDYIYVSATPFTLMTPPDGQDAQGNPDPSAPPPEQYMYCPCGLSRGQLVTICCTGKDCDNSTKIDEMPLALPAPLPAPAQEGPPEEKRAKTTFNQFKF